MDTTTTEPEIAEFTDEVSGGSRELSTEHRSSAVAPADVAAVNTATMLAMVERLALDDRVDAGKLETVMRVANEQQDRELVRQFRQDKNAAVREMPLIRKDGRIVIPGKNGDPDRVQGHFEKWSDVQAAVTPVLERHNLVLTHRIDHADNQTIVIAVLTHDNAHEEESGPMRLPLDTSGGKNNVQGAGSSQTYGMRYTTRAICGLKLVGGQGDDDGHLIALRDEPLNDQQQKRLIEAEAASANGPEAYEEWFGSIPPADRAWMVQTGRHAEFGGQKALPGAQARSAASGGDARTNDEKPSQQAQNGNKRKKPSMTKEQWVEKYEADCAAAQTLDELALLQDGAKNARDRLKAEDPTLHQRTVTAGSEAFDRLSAGEG